MDGQQSSAFDFQLPWNWDWHSAEEKDGTKVVVPCPQVVKDYNDYMGSVSKHDMLRQMYVVNRKGEKNGVIEYFLACLAWLLLMPISHELLSGARLPILFLPLSDSTTLVSIGLTSLKRREGDVTFIYATIPPIPQEFHS